MGVRAEREAGRLPALVLASASPQRRAILARLGVRFTSRPTGVSERDSGDPGEVALQNALRKATAARRPDAREVLLGCDTLVALDGRIYGKPTDESAARDTLRALAGATHEVFSGLALLQPGERSEPDRSWIGPRTAIARTAVTFRELDDDLLDWYVGLGEWRGRAGGYAIQGAGAALVRSLRGDYENIVGLPLATLLDLYPELLKH